MKYPSVCARERKADTIVHVLGVSGAVIAGALLVTFAAIHLDLSVTIACALYALTMLFSKTVSALYHIHPRDERRKFMRRLDHAAIYALIAGTFTPLLILIGSVWSIVVLSAVWVLAIPAIIFKLVAEDLEPRWSLASYLGLGWLGTLALPEFAWSLPASASAAIIAGGLVYTAGTFFYARKVQSFRYAIWHAFVLAGSGTFFAAICLAVFSN